MALPSPAGKTASEQKGSGGPMPPNLTDPNPYEAEFLLSFL